MRPELEAELRKQQAQKKFAETADTFSNAVYEATDGFKSVAERFKTDVKTAANVRRTPAQGTTGLLANQKLLAALFAPDSVEKKRNTEAVETAPGQLVSAASSSTARRARCRWPRCRTRCASAWSPPRPPSWLARKAPTSWPPGRPSEALIATIHEGKLEKPDSPEMYRHHFRLLREGLGAWMQAKTAPVGMPSYVDFLGGVTTALDHVRDRHHGAKVLVVSSGGPISTAVGHVLGTSAETTIELNLRIRNTSVTEFAFTPKRHMLVTYNTLPHLDGPAYEGWVTYA
jgi:hypothetical protein